MNVTKNFTSCLQSWRDSQQDCTENFATANLLLSENLGKICGRILARFWLPGLLLPGENSRQIDRRRDFGHQDFCFSMRILARFTAGSRRDFGCLGFCFLVRILATFTAGLRRDFCRQNFCFSVRILARFVAGSW